MGYKRKPKIIDGVEHWQCTRCEDWFTRNNFYKEKRSSIGIKSECKKCHVKTSIESRDPENHRKTNREWMKSSGYGKRPEVRERERMRSKRRARSIKAKCRDLLNDAVRVGVVIKPNECSNCGSTDRRIEAHHESYYRPLEVVWLCYQCHSDLHRGVWVVEFEKIDK
jgi:hypothetical protein